MANPRPFNRSGIWGIKSVGTPTVTADSVTFNFTSHPFLMTPYNGILIVDITAAAPTGTTGTLPVFFKTGNNARVAATKGGGVPLTSADISASGYYLFFFDRGAGTFQVFNSVV
ncbi:MAG: hypothetical protein NC344_10250 [Bacteroidales bacterium]|nr:hypothetical protein [Bacteroidales bacterium]MCM1148185.1 hypothetical protein [Bacteroidales bacterium]MCM1207088.1 hypothetical protein [Bacillota bacterium]MCM1510832.1 hypothetical protein [Clostridium sp.]